MPLVTFDPAKTMYLRADDHYTWVHSPRSAPYLSSHNIGHLVPQFPGFVRIRKGVLINPSFIARLYQTKPARVVMKDKSVFLVSVRKRKDAINQLTKPAPAR